MKNPFEEISERFDRLERLIESKNLAVPAPETDTWFSLAELCHYLPDKPAKPTIYSYVQNRKIPFYKKGKALMFLKSEIDLYLKSGRRRTSTEISQEVDQYFTNSNQES